MTYLDDTERLSLIRSLTASIIKDKLVQLSEQAASLQKALSWVDGTEPLYAEEDLALLAWSTARIVADLKIPGMEVSSKAAADIYYKYSDKDPAADCRYAPTANDRKHFSNSTNIHEDPVWEIDLKDLLTEDAQVD